MKALKLFLLFFILNISHVNHSNTNVTIFVHGTRTVSSPFIKYANKNNRIINIKEIPKSYITRSICKTLSKADPNNFSEEFFYVFGWSGKLSPKERRNAAKIFYNEIIDLIEELKKKNINPIINLITHSHGGNVTLNLANSFNDSDLKFKIDNLILLACPVQEQTCKLIKCELFQNIYNIYSTLDLTQILDPQGLHFENKNKKVPFFSKRTFEPCPKLKQAKIRINNAGISHVGFLRQNFVRHLPKILEKMKSLNDNNPSSLIKI